MKKIWPPVRNLYLILFLVVSSSLNAQVPPLPTDLPNEPVGLDQYYPEEPAPGPAGKIIHEEPDVPSMHEQTIIESLTGLVFVSSLAELNTKGVSDKGLGFKGTPVLDHVEFRDQIKELIGKPVTLNILDDITRKAVLFYRLNGNPVVDVLVPEQNISTGVVQILVLVGKRGELSTEKNVYFKAKRLEGYIRLERGKLIDGKTLTEDLVWINQNPFRQVDLVYMAGEEFQETDIILSVSDRVPFRVYGGYENSGTSLTGYDRYITGFNWGDAFGLDHLMNYQHTRSKDGKRLSAHTMSYFIPLPWRHKLWLIGSYSKSDAPFGPFKLQGHSLRASTRYIIPLDDIKKYNYKHELTFGTDLVHGTNRLFFLGGEEGRTSTTIAQFMSSYHGQRSDSYGFSSFDLSVFYSPGGFNSRNTDEVFNRIRNL